MKILTASKRSKSTFTFDFSMSKVISYQVAESIDIKKVKDHLKTKPLHANSDELFYQTGDGRYLYIFKYGVITFYNYDESGVSQGFEQIIPFTP
jgi:required for meiotic nuclear division protein 1